MEFVGGKLTEPSGIALRTGAGLRAALRLGFSLSFDDITADQFYAMLAIEEAQERFTRLSTAS